jgi:holo-[acyl-carrier protein] synthase
VGSTRSTSFVGVGIDLVDVHRLAPSIRRERFLWRVFSRREISEARRSRRPEARLAWTFAAKEAFMKAVGAGIGEGISFTDIEVLGGPADPALRPNGPAADLLNRQGVSGVHVTGSCASGVALAAVVLERRADPYNRRDGEAKSPKEGIVVRVEHSLVIKRPPADVFSYSTDLERVPEWQGTVHETRSDGPLRQGARISEVRNFLGRKMESEVEVTAWEPDRRFALKVLRGPVQYAFEQTVEPTDGGTTVRIVLEGDPKGFFNLVEPLLERAVRRQVEADYEQLKDILEFEES